MDWGSVSQDQLEEGLEHFAGLSAAGWARVCELISVVDVRQSWMTDGARSLVDWVAARLRVRRQTAARLVSVARLLVDEPFLYEHFSDGQLSLDQVEALASMATPETEEALIEQALGMTSAALDQMLWVPMRTRVCLIRCRLGLLTL